jgi:hypothetical protein
VRDRPTSKNPGETEWPPFYPFLLGCFVGYFGPIILGSIGAHNAVPALTSATGTGVSMFHWLHDFIASAEFQTFLKGAIAGFLGLLMRYYNQQQIDKAADVKKELAENQEKLRETTIETADKVKEVLAEAAVETSERLDKQDAVMASTHALVNSGHLATTRIAAVALRDVAGLTEGTPRHASALMAADVAENELREQESRQEFVDAMPGTNSEKSGL